MAAEHRRTVLVAHPSTDLYGSDRVMLETVDALLASGWDVVVTIPRDGPLARVVEEHGGQFTVCPSPVLRRSALSPGGLLKVGLAALHGFRHGHRLMTAVRPDVVYVSTLTMPLWLLLSRLRGLPVICHVHEAERSAPWLLRRLLTAPLRLADTVLANSAFTANVITSAGAPIRRRTHVLPNAVQGPPHGHVPARARPSSPLRLLFVGRLTHRKGADLAVAAVDRLARSGVPATLDVVGDAVPGHSAFEEALRDEVRRLGLDEVVRFHGFTSDVWPHLAECDVAVVPSRLEESFGNTAVEALLAARPVVASDRGGLIEATEGYAGARTFDPDDEAGLADAVQSLVSAWADVRDGLEADRRQAAYRHSSSRYRARLVDVVDGASRTRPDRRT